MVKGPQKTDKKIYSDIIKSSILKSSCSGHMSVVESKVIISIFGKNVIFFIFLSFIECCPFVESKTDISYKFRAQKFRVRIKVGNLY